MNNNAIIHTYASANKSVATITNARYNNTAIRAATIAANAATAHSFPRPHATPKSSGMGAARRRDGRAAAVAAGHQRLRSTQADRSHASRNPSYILAYIRMFAH